MHRVHIYICMFLCPSVCLSVFLFCQISNRQVFEEAGYYTWMYSGSMVWSNLATGGVIAMVILFTLLPLWPQIAKAALWWLCMTFSLGMFGFIMVRLLLFLVLSHHVLGVVATARVAVVVGGAPLLGREVPGDQTGVRIGRVPLDVRRGVHRERVPGGGPHGAGGVDELLAGVVEDVLRHVRLVVVNKVLGDQCGVAALVALL